MKNHQDNAGHMTKMDAMPICKKQTSKISILGTTRPIFMKLCMKHDRPKPIIFCSNYNPWFTLTFFMARSNFAT